MIFLSNCMFNIAVTHSYLTLQSGKLVEIVKIHVWLLDTLEYAILKQGTLLASLAVFEK